MTIKVPEKSKNLKTAQNLSRTMKNHQIWAKFTEIPKMKIWLLVKYLTNPKISKPEKSAKIVSKIQNLSKKSAWDRMRNVHDY